MQTVKTLLQKEKFLLSSQRLPQVLTSQWQQTVDGNLYTWGRNNNGQIGNGTDTSDVINEKNPSEVSNKENLVPSPQKVAYFTDYNVVMQGISAGGDIGNSYAMALSSEGDVFAWGSNKFNQVENSDREIVSTPVYVPVSRMTSIAAGKGDEFTTSYGVQELGKVLAWGSNESIRNGRRCDRPCYGTSNSKRRRN